MNEIQDIFQQYGEDFRNKQSLPINILKAMSSIENCRTSALGWHVDVCDDCGHMRISYNSCRNRHCPKCQSLAKERWIESQKSNLLNVQYFHVVFTIPNTLNTIAFQNQKIVYNILFKAVAETYIQGKLNFYGVNKHLENSYSFENSLSAQYQKEWVVYCKLPFKSSHSVIEYLGRYTHRVAISNNRIVSVKDGFVSFK